MSEFKDFHDYLIFGYCNLGDYDKAKAVRDERWRHYHWYLHNDGEDDPEPVVQLKGFVDTMPIMGLAELTLKLVEIGENFSPK